MMARTLSYVYKMSILSGIIIVLSALLYIGDGCRELYAAILSLIAGLIQIAMSVFTFVRKRELPKGFDLYLLAVLIVTTLVSALNWYVNGADRLVDVLLVLMINISNAVMIIIVLYEKKKYGHKETDDSERSDI